MRDNKMECIICGRKDKDEQRAVPDVCSICYDILKDIHKDQLEDYLEQFRKALKEMKRSDQ
jgi:hypothetical protein